MLDRHPVMRPPMGDRRDDGALPIGPAIAGDLRGLARPRIASIGSDDELGPHGFTVVDEGADAWTMVASLASSPDNG